MLETRRILARLAAGTAALLLTGCMTLDYDLSSVPVVLDARPAAAGIPTEPLHIEAGNVLWVHGLFGQDMPDVAALVSEAVPEGAQVAGFRVTQAGSFHDWLLTHLTLTLVRTKRVTIEGQIIR